MKRIIVIAGPTAVGKTKYAIEVAKAFDGEIVSCDSMQLYRYMDIGSAKPTAEEQAQVKHYLVDQIDPREKFSVARYQDLAKAAIEEILAKDKMPVIAGGTGLYLNSLLYEMDFSGTPENTNLRQELEEAARQFGGDYLHTRLQELDPVAAERIHPNNIKKMIRALEGAISGYPITDFQNCKKRCSDYEAILVGLTRNRQELYDRINMRVDLLVDAGLFDEVNSLLAMGLSQDDISMKGIGYKEIIGYFEDSYSREDAIELIKKNTRHLAKRQLTWFRRYEDMAWFNLSDYANDDEGIEDVIKWLKNR